VNASPTVPTSTIVRERFLQQFAATMKTLRNERAVLQPHKSQKTSALSEGNPSRNPVENLYEALASAANAGRQSSHDEDALRTRPDSALL
jgi:hypothetical protein